MRDRGIPSLLLLSAVGTALLVATPCEAGVGCKFDGARCKTNQACCSGVCTAFVCGSPTTTTATSTSSTTAPPFSTTTSTTLMTGCPLPATGQVTCWDSNANVISCDGTGQDGDIRAGAPLSYTDNGDGTITDNNTGLVWEKKSQDGSVHDVSNTYTWDQAFSVHVATLKRTGFAGRTDWRLPNVRELGSIANYENYSPGISLSFNQCSSGCTVLTGSCTSTQLYWSSSTLRENPFLAWVANPLDGGVFGASKSELHVTRAVRGGSSFTTP